MANVTYKQTSNTNTLVYVDGAYVGFIEKTWRNPGRGTGVKPHYQHEVRATVNGVRVEYRNASLAKVKEKIVAAAQPVAA